MFGLDHLTQSLFYNEVKATSFVQTEVSKKWPTGRLQVPICKTNKQKPTTLAMACCQGRVDSTPIMVCAWELRLIRACCSREIQRSQGRIRLHAAISGKEPPSQLGEWFLLKACHLCISRKSPMIQTYLKTAGICYGQKTMCKGQTCGLPAAPVSAYSPASTWVLAVCGGDYRGHFLPYFTCTLSFLHGLWF